MNIKRLAATALIPLAMIVSLMPPAAGSVAAASASAPAIAILSTIPTNICDYNADTSEGFFVTLSYNNLPGNYYYGEFHGFAQLNIAGPGVNVSSTSFPITLAMLDSTLVSYPVHPAYYGGTSTTQVRFNPPSYTAPPQTTLTLTVTFYVDSSVSDSFANPFASYAHANGNRDLLGSGITQVATTTALINCTTGQVVLPAIDGPQVPNGFTMKQIKNTPQCQNVPVLNEPGGTQVDSAQVIGGQRWYVSLFPVLLGTDRTQTSWTEIFDGGFIDGFVQTSCIDFTFNYVYGVN